MSILFGQQFVMGALFEHSTLIENNDLIAVGHGAQAMGDDDRCSIFGQLLERIQDRLRTTEVNRSKTEED